MAYNNIYKKKVLDEIFNDNSDSECDYDTLNKIIEINTNTKHINQPQYLNQQQSNNQPKYFDVPFDEKYKEEINKDHANNLLLDRLNSELNFRINGKQQKIFFKPYVDDIMPTNQQPKKVNTTNSPKKSSIMNKTIIPSRNSIGQRRIIN